MRTVLTATFAAALALSCAGAAPLAAQMAMPEQLHGAGTPTDVAAGTYALEPNHTQVTFSVSHMGISPFAGTFSGGSGALTIDPAKLDSATVTVTIPTKSVQTTSTKLTEELNSTDWLDTAKYPDATFKSTAVHTKGPGAMIEGLLTLHGVTKPVTLYARFFGTATNPMSKKASVGFLGRLPIKRSDFGVSKYVPLVSDDTVLVINAAFEKQ